MKASEPIRNEAMPDVLRQDIERERVVILTSNITDIRPITTYLEQHGIDHRVVRMGMQSQAMRERFTHLERATGWHQLPQIFVDGRFIGGYEEFFAHDFAAQEGKASKRVPAAAFALGAGGLIPFLFGAAALWLAPPGWRADVLRMLFAYSAIILAFIGAVHWGLALRPNNSDRSRLWQRLGLSVLPALVAWGSFSQQPVMAFTVLIAAYLGQYVFDVMAVRIGWAPRWYLRLRSGLTGVAIICLFASLWALSMQQELVDSVTGAGASGLFIPDHVRGALILI